MGLHNARWQRPDQPALSAMTTHQSWCRVQLYGPTVVRVGDTYKLWYLGNASDTHMPEMLLGFAESKDGVHWTEYPASTDGLHWTRDPQPVVTANDERRSVIYPFVLRDGDGYVMWYGCHVDGGVFEIFCSSSADGLTWTHHLDEPAFAATRDPTNFDGRYTSTPCVLDDGDRYLLYYCSRDLGALYAAGDGTIKSDSRGIYRHIGVAICPKSSLLRRPLDSRREFP